MGVKPVGDGRVAYAEATKIVEKNLAREFIDEAADAPVMSQRQEPMNQKERKTVEVPQVQYIGETVHVPVVKQRHIPTIRAVQEAVEVPQVQFRDRVVDVPVVMQRQVLQERILERIVENTHVPVPCVKKEIIEVMQHGLTETMKEKTGRQGNLSDEVEKLKSQLYDGESTLPADKEPASNLDGSCAARAPEWEERRRFRAEELVTIHDTTKLLNDYESLELPEEILPSSSMMQVQSDKRGVACRECAVVRKSSGSPGEEMASVFQQKQTDGDNKKTCCSASVDRTKGEDKSLAIDISHESVSAAQHRSNLTQQRKQWQQPRKEEEEGKGRKGQRGRGQEGRKTEEGREAEE